MDVANRKSANKQYKEYKASGGVLSFSQWIDREKKKNFVSFDGINEVPVNKPLNDSIQKVINDMHRSVGYKTDLEKKYVFGVHKNVWLGIGVGVVLLIGGYVVYQKRSKLFTK